MAGSPDRISAKRQARLNQAEHSNGKGKISKALSAGVRWSSQMPNLLKQSHIALRRLYNMHTCTTLSWQRPKNQRNLRKRNEVGRHCMCLKSRHETLVANKGKVMVLTREQSVVSNKRCLKGMEGFFRK